MMKYKKNTTVDLVGIEYNQRGEPFIYNNLKKHGNELLSIPIVHCKFRKQY